MCICHCSQWLQFKFRLNTLSPDECKTLKSSTSNAWNEAHHIYNYDTGSRLTQGIWKKRALDEDTQKLGTVDKDDETP